MLCSMTCCTHMSIYLAMEILPEDGILSRSIMDFIKERQLTWLEHIIKMDPKQNMRRLVKNALIQHPRRGGHSPSTAKISGTQTRKPLTAIGEIDCNDPNALLREWTMIIAKFPQGWHDGVKKRLRKWGARKKDEDEARAAQRDTRSNNEFKRNRRINNNKSHLDCFLFFSHLQSKKTRPPKLTPT